MGSLPESLLVRSIRAPWLWAYWLASTLSARPIPRHGYQLPIRTKPIGSADDVDKLHRAEPVAA